MTAISLDEVRFQVADHLERLVQASVESRGAMRAPNVDLTSAAHQNLRQDSVIGTTDLPEPIATTLGHVERLLLAGDDQVRCLAHLMRKPTPSWFGHLALIRSAVEAMSRAWLLTDPMITVIERVRRFANERLYELQHAQTMLDKHFAGLPDEVRTAITDHVGTQHGRLSAWAKSHGLTNPGGQFGDRRPDPTALLVSIYSKAGDTSNVLGAWNYSELSSVIHGLPDGMSRYRGTAGPDDHPHLVMTAEDVAGSVEPVLTVHASLTDRLAQFFRWPISEELHVEIAAARLFINRAGGAIEQPQG